MTIVGNGSHVNDIYKRRREGWAFPTAFQELSFEPDEPIWTPRIAAEIDHDGVSTAVSVGSVRRGENGAETFEVISEWVPEPGAAIALRTYDSDGTTITSHARPTLVTGIASVSGLADSVWRMLGEAVRVGLIAAVIPYEPDAVLVHE